MVYGETQEWQMGSFCSGVVGGGKPTSTNEDPRRRAATFPVANGELLIASPLTVKAVVFVWAPQANR